MRTYGPPLAAGAKRAAPLELSAVAGRGVKDVLARGARRDRRRPCARGGRSEAGAGLDGVNLAASTRQSRHSFADLVC